MTRGLYNVTAHRGNGDIDRKTVEEDSNIHSEVRQQHHGCTSRKVSEE